MSSPRTLRAAICHASPVFLEAASTTQKALSLIHSAASNNANLIVFPETFIPAFPIWSALQAPHLNHNFFFRMAQQSIYIDGPEITALREAANQAGVFVNMGFSEKSRNSSATLWNSNVLIGDDGAVLVHHRKLMPTFFEKLTWAPGDGAGLVVAQTKFGKIGTLICGENTNPLARYALMSLGEEVHISTWPGIWPTRVKSKTVVGEGTGSGKGEQEAKKNYDNVAANRIRAAAHCFEAKCFGISAAGFIDQACKDNIAQGCEDSALIMEQMNEAPQAASLFLDPTGAILPGFVIDANTGEKMNKEFLRNEEGILYADLDLDQCIEGKQYHDVVGGYQRLDVFQLKVDRTRREPTTFKDEKS